MLQKNWLRLVKKMSVIALAAYMLFFPAYVPAVLAVDEYILSLASVPHSSLPAQKESSNDTPALIETCPPPPGQGGNEPSTSNPTVEIGEIFTIDDHVRVSAPSVNLEVTTIEPESLIEAVDISNNQYRALSPGTVKMAISYSGQYKCSPDGENTTTVSFSGSLQMVVTVSGATIYLPLIHN